LGFGKCKYVPLSPGFTFSLLARKCSCLTMLSRNVSHLYRCAKWKLSPQPYS
jgi:hypothetical protein